MNGESLGIYSIDDKETLLCLRPFFKACGFADDRMGSTTMMFTKELGGLIWSEKKDVGSSKTLPTGQSKLNDL